MVVSEKLLVLQLELDALVVFQVWGPLLKIPEKAPSMEEPSPVRPVGF